MERVLVLGAKGMVGSALMGILSSGFELVGLGPEELDITDEGETLRTVQGIGPSIVIHAAAYTDVDGCEKEPRQAFLVNSKGTLHVARACHQRGARLLYVSTDYVFDGKASRPYKEVDPVNPINIYGRSKLGGERHVQRFLDEFTIVRTQWLFDDRGRNFVRTLLNWVKRGKPLTIVRDQIGSPTYVADLSHAILRLLQEGSRGVFHVANSSSCSWYDFAQEILKTAGVSDIDIIPVDGASLGRPAPRPHYSVLDCEKLTQEAGLSMRPWQKALREFMKGRNLM